MSKNFDLADLGNHMALFPFQEQEENVKRGREIFETVSCSHKAFDL